MNILYCFLYTLYISYNVLQGPRGLFRGYVSTIARDIPFSFIQYPLWEYLKVRLCMCDHYPLFSYKPQYIYMRKLGLNKSMPLPLSLVSAYT